MRETVRWITSPIKQINRYGKASLKISKRLYQKLPINYQTKAAHRRLIANHFPKLLLLSGAHESTIPQSLIPIIPETTTDELGDLFAFAERLEIPSSNKPKVSIIIPIYGQIEYTLRCLESIVNNQPKITFEVIVVDDCSPDESFVILKKVRGIKLLRNKKNKGFIRTCNYGAKVAKGEYLYFLNNDTQVLPNWLDALVQTFIDFPGT